MNYIKLTICLFLSIFSIQLFAQGLLDFSYDLYFQRATIDKGYEKNIHTKPMSNYHITGYLQTINKTKWKSYLGVGLSFINHQLDIYYSNSTTLSETEFHWGSWYKFLNFNALVAYKLSEQRNDYVEICPIVTINNTYPENYQDIFALNNDTVGLITNNFNKPSVSFRLGYSFYPMRQINTRLQLCLYSKFYIIPEISATGYFMNSNNEKVNFSYKNAIAATGFTLRFKLFEQ